MSTWLTQRGITNWPEVVSLKRLFLVYSLALVLVLSLLATFSVFQHPDLFFLDRAFQWRGPREPNNQVAIVAISQEDFELGAPRWPWPRSLMARLIDQVSSYQPGVIAIDILYTERSNTEAVFTREQFEEIQPSLYQVLSGREVRVQSREGTRLIGPGSPGFDEILLGAGDARAQDRELAEAVQRAIDRGVDVVLAAQAISRGNTVGLAEPYPELASAAGGSIGLVGIRLDPDGVLRSYLPYGQDKDGRFVYGLAVAGVARLKGVDLPETPSSGGHVPLGTGWRVKASDGQFLVNFPGPAATHPTFVARDVLRGEPHLSDQLRGKLVFIGVTDPSVEDLQPTPFSGSQLMPGVEFHAAAAGTILSDSFISRAPRYQEVLVLVVLSLAALALGRFAPPLPGLGGALGLVGGLGGVWISLFVWGDYFLPVTASLTGIFMGYTLAITERVSVEHLEKQQTRSMLSRYLAPGVVKEILSNPDAAQLGGKRAEITVLFSDIRGFTSLAERLAPEEVVALLNEYLTAMTEIIFDHEGTIDKFEGDAILAFFGAPQPHDDAPERAIRAALEMQERLAGLESRWRQRTQAPLRIGIGINTGPAVVGNIGSQRRMDYTIIGDTVNLASRLQDLTKEYGAPILVSASTRARVERMCQLRSLGPVEIRGRQQPVDLYALVGLRTSMPSPGEVALAHSI